MEHRTHALEDDVVVFNISMTIAKPHRVDLWWPVFVAMPRMISELKHSRRAAERGEGEGEDLGFLGATTLMGRRGPWVVQYWCSTENLYDYAANPDARHLPAWKAYNAVGRKHPGAVGIWHETLAVPAAGIETLYGNGADVGLGAATGTVEVTRRGHRARERMGSKVA